MKVGDLVVHRIHKKGFEAIPKLVLEIQNRGGHLWLVLTGDHEMDRCYRTPDNYEVISESR